MAQTYMSFGEQTLHYFDRPHEAVPEGQIDSPAAWHGADLADSDEWIEALSDAQIAELDTALAQAKATGKATGDLTKDDFPLPTLSAEVARWRQEIRSGRGFQVVRGVPVERWGDADSGVFFWCLGLHLGRPGGQNPEGHLLGHVTDTGEAKADANVRKYKTADNIAYHCDAADVVGLLCLRKARRGGQSRIVSSVSVYNTLFEERPDLVSRLFEPFNLDTRNEEGSSGMKFVPIPPCRYADTVLRTFYHSDYFRSAQRHKEAPRFSEGEKELLDTYEEIAARPELCLDMDLEPGDVQLLSNHVILHARTDYDDWPDPAKKRHLLRLWLSL